MDVNAVMDQLGTALASISGLRVFDFPPDSAYPPFAIVDLPEDLDYDAAFGGTTDRASFPVTVAVGKVNDRSARDQLAAYMARTGASSIKSAVEAATVGQTARVMSCEPLVFTIAGVEYLAAVFNIDVLA